MEIRERLNPRSFKSIRAAIQGGRIRNRGQLLREIHEAFRNLPVIPKIATETSTPPESAGIETREPKVVMSAEAIKAAEVGGLIDVAVAPAEKGLVSGGTSLGTKESATITEGKDGAIK